MAAKQRAAGQGADAKAQLKEFRRQKNKEKKEIEEANMARKSTLQEQLRKKDKSRFELRQRLDAIKNFLDSADENAKIFEEVIKERKRFLMSAYLMKGQDDLEQILETLHSHFKHIQLTSFETLARDNKENKSAKELLEQSTSELKMLAKTLELLQMDEEDVRYEVFVMIYDMLFDNIQLRVKQNKLSGRVLAQSQLNMDQAVYKYHT